MAVYQLLDNFCILSGQYILQSDNGRKWATKVATEVTKSWPYCKMVHWKAERAEKDVKSILACWMRECNKWSGGPIFIQCKMQLKIQKFWYRKIRACIEYCWHLRRGALKLYLDFLEKSKPNMVSYLTWIVFLSSTTSTTP